MYMLGRFFSLNIIKKEVMKKAILIIMVMFVTLLTGCGSVDYQLVINGNGTITERLYLPVNEQFFLSSGATSTQFINIRKEIMEFCKTECDSQLLTYFQNVDEDNEVENKDAYKNGVGIKYYYNSEYFVIEYNFISSEIRNYFYNIDEEKNKDNTKQENGFLINKTIITTKTKFATTSGGELLVKYYTDEFYNIILKNAPLVYSKIPEAQYTYSYVTPQKQLHSDAQSVEYQDGFYIHTWNISGDDLDKTINFYTISANTPVWYALILSITFVSCGIMFLVYFIKNKKNKNV